MYLIEVFLKYDCFEINDSVEGEGRHKQNHLELVENIVSAQKMCGWEARGLRLVRGPRGLGHGLLAPPPPPFNTPLCLMMNFFYEYIWKTFFFFFLWIFFSWKNQSQSHDNPEIYRI